ncbi:hypothetical protein PENTCL1PPCAC_5707, partial [Pristionchus entomophagus]
YPIDCRVVPGLHPHSHRQRRPMAQLLEELDDSCERAELQRARQEEEPTLKGNDSSLVALAANFSPSSWRSYLPFNRLSALFPIV